ncbi:universal stress protein [Haladaptatus sp. F3-133]|uniref:Universal stress protein n=1 Tax=Halorutilus salinus TaxID=2487751 RepID=A0A9Q4C2Q5_9EURY|nr:universal stress protein [Halorutilus salinus]MCX2818012.1 universal stress protein [Halorutilus salinus]
MKTVLGIGGTDDSIRALEHTLDRVAETGDELTVAVIENPDSTPAGDEVEERVEGIIEEYGVDADVVRLSGDPGSALVEFAESNGYDEIVLGGGETSAMGKIQVGRVAEFVLLNSHTSVKLVR